MTIRQYIAAIYAVFAVTIGISGMTFAASAAANPGLTVQEVVELGEIEPEATGFAEDDDLPAYLSAGDETPGLAFRHDAPPQHTVNLMYVDRSVLSADGLGGLRWDVLIQLALMAVACLAIALYGGRKDAAH